MQKYGLHISLAVLLGLAALMIFEAGHERSHEHEMVGEAALDFQLPVLQAGQPFGTSRMGPRDYEGQVVVIDFWALYCEPCRDAMPDIQRLHEAYAGTDVALLSVNVDPPRRGFDRPGVISEYFRRNGYTFPVLLDYGPASEAYNVTSIPYVVVVDQTGAVRFVHTRPASYDSLSEEIDALLGERESS